MERIFYKTDYYDPDTNHLIYIFDTSYLPSPNIIDYDSLIITMMALLPDHPYVLVMFSCGLNKINWIWGITFLKKFLADTNNMKNLIKLITVHDSWFVKSFTQIISNFNVTKNSFAQLNNLIESFGVISLGDALSKKISKSKIINCNTLSQLHRYLDITKLKISLNIYRYNLELEGEIKHAIASSMIDQTNTNLNEVSDPVFYHHFYQIFNIVDTYAEDVELLFHKPGNKINTDILYQCIHRNQLFWINDWDLFCISSAFKRILTGLPVPLISVEEIVLPIKDDFNYTCTIFQKILNNFEDPVYAQVLVQLCNLFSRVIQNSSVTKHSSSTITKCFGYCLSHQLISSQSKDSMLIISRFFKNLLDHWNQVGPLYEKKYPKISDIINKKEFLQQPDDSYDLSYDITIEDNGEEDNDYRVSYNTSNILNNHSTLSSSNTTILSPTKPDSKVLFVSHNTISPSRQSTLPERIASSKALSDVSNISLQYPPQKYRVVKNLNKASNHSISPVEEAVSRKPVIRGRKVGELARLYEERNRGLELLRTM